MPPKPKVFAAAQSADKDAGKAVSEVLASARKALSGARCDLALFFVSEGYAGLDPARLAGDLSRGLGCRVALGCNASGIIGGAREVEMDPAMSVLAMSLPGVKAFPFSLAPQELAALSGPDALLKSLDLYPTDAPNFLCLADPMSCDIERLLELFNAAYPGRPIVGGLASGTAVGRPNWLVLDGEVAAGGAVGVALSGPIEVETLVAQGCRPIGEPLIITKADRHVLYELASRPAFEVLRGVVESLSAEDRELARHSLFAGLAMSEYRKGFSRGDFLIRQLMGYDAASGALMVGAALRRGQTLQFQLRDARTSAEDLRELLARSPERGGRPAGALLVSCCGRGKGLYGKPDHDAGLVQSLRGPLPLAGFFANGELGPVAGTNFIHGFTSSLAVIR